VGLTPQAAVDRPNFQGPSLAWTPVTSMIRQHPNWQRKFWTFGACDLWIRVAPHGCLLGGLVSGEADSLGVWTKHGGVTHPEHEVLPNAISYAIVALRIEREPKDGSEAFLDLTVRRGTERRQLRFWSPQEL